MSKRHWVVAEGHTAVRGYPDMADSEFSRPEQSGASEIRTKADKEQRYAPKARPNKKSRALRFTVIVLLVTAFYLVPFMFLGDLSRPASAEDFQFGSETVNKGSSVNPANRNSEDAVYNELIEGDQYMDSNFSGSTEDVIVGTAGGGAFPGSLDSDDATRRSYAEASGGGSPTYQVLRPTSDGSVTTMVEYPTTPTTHWDKVDETNVGGDNDATYLEGVTNAQESELGMSDPSDPGGSPNIDVTMWHISRGETTSACTVVWGIEIGGVEYQGGSTTMTSITYANFSYEWTVDPSDSLEWTLADVNGLECYIRVTDANPDTRTTQIGLLVEFNPSVSYQLDAQITYSGVTSTSQTTSYAGNSPPYWTSTPGTSGKVGELYAYHAQATDEEGDPISYMIVSAPPEFSINASTGLFQGVPRLHGDFAISLQAFDGYSYIWQNFTISVKDPPVSGSDRQTSEDTSLLLWVALIASGSIAFGISLVTIRKKRSKKRKKR